MSNYAGKQTRTAVHADAPTAVQQSAGKRTLTEQAYVPATDVQLHGNAMSSEANVQRAAARGLATPSGPLPNLDVIQRSFGRHDVSAVQAHTGSDAAGTAREMNADGYASKDHVVLASGDLFTEAHEAAHAVQQRGGVQLKGGVGQQGDIYERNADEVASLVVQGKSAEALLDPFAGGGATASAGHATQLKLSIGGADAKSGTVESDVDAVWARISADPRLAEVQAEARALLARWITQQAKYDDVNEISENRHYPSDELLVRALAGDVRAAGNLAHEGELAAQTLSEGEVNGMLAGVLHKISALQQAQSAGLGGAGERTGRYAGWAYEKTTLQLTLENPPADLRGRIAFIADYALMMRRDIKSATGGWDFRMSAEHSEGRHTHHNTNEDAAWVKSAREASAPLSAGPSATTAQVLALGVSVGASGTELEALAWALFTLWNMMPLHQSGTHRFHEVMDVAAQYGVSYTRFQYSTPPSQGPRHS
jgi:Domain of unknown function (DUF4157)